MIFILIFVLLLILPGFLLTSLLAPHLPWFQRLPTAFSLSLALLGIPAVLLLNLHARLSLLAFFALATNLILIALFIRNAISNRESTKSTNKRINELTNKRINPITLLLIPTLLAAAFALYLFITTTAIRDFGDHWFYLHFIRNYLDFPLDPAINPLIGQDITPGTLTRAATNGWWVLIASLVQVSGQPLLEAYWLYLPPLLMVVSLFAFYSLAWELFEDHRAALSAVLLQLLLYLTTIGSHDWIGQGFFTRIAEDKYLVWLVLLPVSFSLLLRYTKTSQRRFLVMLGASAASLAITHPFGLLQFSFATACFALVYLPFNWRNNSVFKSAIFLSPLLLFLIVPILQQFSTDANALLQFIPSELQTPPNDTHLMVLSAENNRYLLHPHLIFHPLILAGVVLAPLLLLKIRKNTAAQFLFATTIIPLLLLYNPITAPVLGRFLTPLLLWRAVWILPPTLVTAYILRKLADWMQKMFTSLKANKWTTLVPNVAPLVVILGIALLLKPYIADGIDFLEDYETRIVTDSQQGLLDYLCENDEITSVVVADPLLNTLIPSCASQSQLLTYRIFQAKQTAAEEIDRFYQSKWISQSTASFLESWQARYVIIPNQSPVADQISLLPEMFVEQYRNNEYSLYEFSSAQHPIVAANEAYIRGDWEKAEAFYVESLEEYSALTQYGLGQVRLALGENADAEPTFLDAIALEATFVSPYLSLTALYQGDGRTTDAQNLLLEALKTNPDSLILHELLGDIYVETEDESAAMEHYRQAVPSSSNANDKLLALGNLYREKGLTTQAIAAYQTVIDEEENLFELATNASYWGAWSRSLTFDRRPERVAAAYQALGKIYEQQGELDSAENAYRRIIHLLPTRENGYRALASLLNQTDRHSETITLYQEAARINFHLSWPFLRLAEAYLLQFERDDIHTDQLNQAITALQRANQIEPDNMENYELLAQAYRLLGQPQQVKTIYQRATENYPYLAWPWLNLGRYYLDVGNIEAAETALTTAISHQPTDQTAYNLIAEAYIDRQEAEKAIQIYREAIAANEERAWPYLGLGNAYLAAGMDDLALAALEDGLAREPDNAAVHATLGSIYRWNVGDPETAVQFYQRAIALNPDQPDAQMALAATLISLGQVEAGLPHLEKALALAPQSGANYQTAGDIMWQLGWVEEALNYYQQALERDRQNAPAHLGLARIYRQKEAFESALRHAQQAVRFSQSIHTTGPAQMEEAQIYLALDRPEEALEQMLAAIETLPNDPWFQATVGDFYHYRQNNPSQAVPFYRKAAELAPQQAILQAALGTALYDAGQTAEAIPFMEQAIIINGNDAAVFLRIGSVLNQYGDWERVVRFYETAVTNGIQNADIFSQLGNAYSALGQEEKAQDQYEKAAELNSE